MRQGSCGHFLGAFLGVSEGSRAVPSGEPLHLAYSICLTRRDLAVLLRAFPHLSQNSCESSGIGDADQRQSWASSRAARRRWRAALRRIGFNDAPQRG